MRYGDVPQDWDVSIIVPTFKKGDATKCENYTRISLMFLTSKIYERLLETKLWDELEKSINYS